MTTSEHRTNAVCRKQVPFAAAQSPMKPCRILRCLDGRGGRLRAIHGESFLRGVRFSFLKPISGHLLLRAMILRGDPR